MKKIVTILLFSIYTLGATEAYQLLKLPILVQHYLQHKQHNKNIGFINFLKEHYPEKIVIDDDFAQDMQLPFKTQQFNTLTLEVVATQPAFIWQPIVYVFCTNNTKAIFQNPYHTQLVEKGIFQPPKA